MWRAELATARELASARPVGRVRAREGVEVITTAQLDEWQALADRAMQSAYSDPAQLPAFARIAMLSLLAEVRRLRDTLDRGGVCGPCGVQWPEHADGCKACDT